ncbi:MAG TPA: hypothetical protein VGG19_05880 [Tepidisphaeraceae bacterium]|jgi:hypothetical protein
MRRAARSHASVPFLVITLGIYAIITLYMLARHAPWRDEADAWLAARDMPLSKFWSIMHHGGTPGLWILILMPFARVGLPYVWLKIVHWSFGFANAAMILTLAPFPKWLRVLLIFSFYLASEYIVIARNYAPLATLLILIAEFYPRRYQRPMVLALLIVLLASIAVHGTIFAAALLGAWGLEALLRQQVRGWVLTAGIIAALGVLLAVAEVLPAPADGQLTGAFVVRNTGVVDYVLSHVFTPLYPQTPGLVMTHLRQHLYPIFLAAWAFPRWLSVMFLLLTLWLLRRNPPLLLAFIFSFAVLIYIFTYKHMGGDRHTGLIWLFTWTLLWILRSERGSQNRYQDVSAWSALWIPAALSGFYCIVITAYRLQERTPYSGAREAAMFLLANHLEDQPIGMYDDNRCESILPYLGKKTAWYAGEKRYGTYMLWNAAQEQSQYDTEASIQRLVEKSANEPDMVLVINSRLPAETAEPFRLLFDNTQETHIIQDETYAIYERR